MMSSIHSISTPSDLLLRKGAQGFACGMTDVVVAGAAVAANGEGLQPLRLDGGSGLRVACPLQARSAGLGVAWAYLAAVRRVWAMFRESATPLPAMSNAVPWSTEKRRKGSPSVVLTVP